MAMTEGTCIVLLPIFVQPISRGQLTLSFVWISSVSNSTNWLKPREDPRSKCLRWSVFNVFSCRARHISWAFWSSSWHYWGENLRAKFHGRLSNNCLKKCTDGKHNSRINTVLRSWLYLPNAPAQDWSNNLQHSCFTLHVMNFHFLKTAQHYPNI